MSLEDSTVEQLYDTNKQKITAKPSVLHHHIRAMSKQTSPLSYLRTLRVTTCFAVQSHNLPDEPTHDFGTDNPGVPLLVSRLRLSRATRRRQIVSLVIFEILFAPSRLSSRVTNFGFRTADSPLGNRRRIDLAPDASAPFKVRCTYAAADFGSLGGKILAYHTSRVAL